MIYYMCKYTPLELFSGLGESMQRLEPTPDSFEIAEGLGHANLCGYGKGVLAAAMAPEVQELILVNCCDVVRRLYDILKKNKPMKFLYLLDLPHKGGPIEERRFLASLKELVCAYEAGTGKRFDEEKMLEAWKASAAGADDPTVGAEANCSACKDANAAEDARKKEQYPVISLQGAHGGPMLRSAVQAHFKAPVRDDTCSGNRRLEKIGDAVQGEILPAYARALLHQQPCMRMLDAAARAKLDQDAAGVIYHTMKFCDYYSFEYMKKKDNQEIPLLKIETDGTKQSEGQLATRLDAFAESLSLSGSRGAAKTEGAYFAGIDSGSASTDVVILDKEKKLVSWAIVPTGAGAASGAGKALSEALSRAGLTEKELACVISTGYGRETIGKGDDSVTEITCHARGAHYLNPQTRTIIDIGGQDSKVIRIDEKGAVRNFVMNDKCAAGTGRFLEMMARTMELSMEEMSALGQKWKEEVTISSMCTVFAESEVVSLIAKNTAAADIIHGLNSSVASKTAALVRRVGGEEGYMMTGGVARNAGIVQVMEKKLGVKIAVSEYAQLCGAIGAALIAME